jgi:hypothetical protein
MDDLRGDQFQVELPLHRAGDMGLGQKVKLSGVATFSDQDYMVNSVNYDLLDPAATVSVQAVRPVDPVLQQALFLGGMVTPFGMLGTKDSRLFLYWVTAQIGKAYVFGTQIDLTNPNPLQFDCSALVEWGCAQVGVYMPRDTYHQEPYCQASGHALTQAQASYIPGAVLFAEGHVAISVGDGQHTIEAYGTGYGVIRGSIFRGGGMGNRDGIEQYSRFRSAFLIPGMLYPPTDVDFAIRNTGRGD